MTVDPSSVTPPKCETQSVMFREREIRIGVLDSGVGGLSFGPELRQSLPQATLIFGLDHAWHPYGKLTESRLLARSIDLVAMFVTHYQIDILVLGCNTLSTLALDSLRARFDLPIVGVVPAVKPAAKLSKQKTFAIVATEATVERPYLDRLLSDFAPGCEVVKVASPGLVAQAEAKVQGKAFRIDDLACLEALRSNPKLDTVVLGCSHYSHLKEELRTIFPQISHWLDTRPAITKRVLSLVAQLGYDATKTLRQSQEPLKSGDTLAFSTASLVLSPLARRYWSRHFGITSVTSHRVD